MELIVNASKEKLRGGFYTPKVIGDFILTWAINGNQNYDILEPSCGDGLFLEQIKEKGYKYNSITAIELDPNEARKAYNIDIPNKVVLNEDFHNYCNSTRQKFDLVIGNPPFIRYQYFDKEQQIKAEKIFNSAGLKYSKLANSWVSFVVGSSLLLKDVGKIGFVIPAEILQVSYAHQIRKFLVQFYNKITIISFRKLVFPDIQQDVLLLLCEKDNSNSHLIEHLEVEDAEELRKLDIARIKKPMKRVNLKSSKWTFYFLEQEEIDFIENLLDQRIIPTLDDYASVEVGMTTGSNEFFSVPKSIVEKYSLQEYAKPAVGRSVQVSGAIFKECDWKLNSESNSKAYILLFPSRNELINNNKALEYIDNGEKGNIHKGYKCRIRDEWQTLPSAWVSEVLFLRRSDIFPKIVINQAKVYTTDTMHRITINNSLGLIKNNKNVNVEAFTASYYNSLSFASAEIFGRSYGGGVLELMPSEVENILLPYNDNNIEILEEIDNMIRKKEHIDKILKFTDIVILKENYGLSESDIKLANKIWKKLLNRRKNRGYSIK